MAPAASTRHFQTPSDRPSSTLKRLSLMPVLFSLRKLIYSSNNFGNATEKCLGSWLLPMWLLRLNVPGFHRDGTHYFWQLRFSSDFNLFLLVFFSTNNNKQKQKKQMHTGRAYNTQPKLLVLLFQIYYGSGDSMNLILQLLHILILSKMCFSWVGSMIFKFPKNGGLRW